MLQRGIGGFANGLRLRPVPAAMCAAMAVMASSAVAQGTGISAKGMTGGLVIPSAYVLPSGTVAFTGGNYMEPRIPHPDKRQNYSFGVGLFPYVELFGR